MKKQWFSVVAAHLRVPVHLRVLFVAVCAVNLVLGKPLADEQQNPRCEDEVYCVGTLLDVVQKAKIFNDSKTFVDMSQVNPPSTTINNFNQLMEKTENNPSQDDIRQFVKDNFVDESELENWTPEDYTSEPAFLAKVTDVQVREFARNLVAIWPTLGRSVRSTVFENPDQHSLLAVPNGFIIPGGRFRELYYWDSYWIIKGLLLSDMTETSRGMLENFLHLVQKYGFVPNGSRVYYLNRSQPPLLTLMVGLYIESTGDVEWLQKNIDILETELLFWLKNRMAVVEKNGVKYHLAHYASNDGTPRPESYSEDLSTCAYYDKDSEKQTCYKQLKSGAESGWDFSTRWFFDESGGTDTNLTHVETRRVAGVDLNAFLCKAFKEISNFYTILNNEKKSVVWLERAVTLQKSIEIVLYDKTDGIWYDYDIKLSKPRKLFYPSNFAPLWSEAYDDAAKDEYGRRAAEYFQKNQLDQYQGGIPTSLDHSGEQWDFPNAWPPLQEFITLGLEKTGNENAKKIAEKLAKIWIEANMRGFEESHVMFEKYDALHSGRYGNGGEYAVQSGFGWTNGVALSFITNFFSNSSTLL